MTEQPSLQLNENLVELATKLMKSQNMLGEILTWLPGNFIVHRIALANKRLREVCQQLGPLTSKRVVVFKLEQPTEQHGVYRVQQT